MLDTLLPDPEGPILEDHAATVRDSLSRNVTVDVVARIGYLVSRFFIPPFVLAHVTLEAYGLWSAAFIMVSYVGLSTMGISTVYIKFVAEYCARREYLKANQLLSTGLCLTIPFCGAVFAIFYFLWPHIVVWLHIAPTLRQDAREVVLSVVAIFLASLSLGAFHDAVVGAQKTDMVQRRWMSEVPMQPAKQRMRKSAKLNFHSRPSRRRNTAAMGRMVACSNVGSGKTGITQR